VITYEYIYNGAGVGAGDLNNDGLPTSYLQEPGLPKVYLNQGILNQDITSNFKGLTNNHGSAVLHWLISTATDA